MNKIIVNNEPLDWQSGMTIRDVLNKKNYTFKMLVIKVNGELVKKNQYDHFLVPKGADVKVIHLVSGG